MAEKRTGTMFSSRAGARLSHIYRQEVANIIAVLLYILGLGLAFAIGFYLRKIIAEAKTARQEAAKQIQRGAARADEEKGSDSEAKDGPQAAQRLDKEIRMVEASWKTAPQRRKCWIKRPELGEERRANLKEQASAAQGRKRKTSGPQRRNLADQLSSERPSNCF